MIKEFQVGVKGVVVVGNTVLVLKSAKGHWDIPGGRIDDDESIEDTLRRELSEELPSLKSYRISDIIHAHRLNKDIVGETGLLLLFYKVVAESFDVVLSDEHQEFRWVTPTTLSDLRTPPTPIDTGYYEALRRAF